MSPGRVSSGRRTRSSPQVRDRRRLDRDTTELARHLTRLGSGRQAGAFHLSWWDDQAMAMAMSRPEFKTQLFRFVDAFPAMSGRHDVTRHIHEYFVDEATSPWLMRTGARLAGRLPGGPAVATAVARRSIERMAHQFIAGAGPADAAGPLGKLWAAGSASTVDLLGEKTLVAAEADNYVERVRELLTVLSAEAAGWAPDAALEADDLGPLSRVNVSIKPTALAPHLHPLTGERGLDEARPRYRTILRAARAVGAFVYLDMEHADVKNLTLRLFREVLSEDEFANLPAGIAIQAYLRDSWHDLAELAAWSATRAQPVTVRLVKGAYWDAETVEAHAAGWTPPTYEQKDQTDANFERCTRLLHDHHGDIRAAIASHNLRSLAYAITYAQHLGLADNGYEIQMLYGMAEPLHQAVRSLGLRHRVYAPVGELVPGMAYLVRRLLENTSNESFVRHRFAEGRALDSLLAPPRPDRLPEPGEPDSDAAGPRGPGSGLSLLRRVNGATSTEHPTAYRPEPVTEWRRHSSRARFATAIDTTANRLGGVVAAHIDGRDVTTAATLTSLDPSDPDTVVATSARCTEDHAAQAVDAAHVVAAAWRNEPASRRAQVLFDAAAWMRARRDELASTQCFEAGKPWDQADADVCEAIDFCEYYGRHALELGSASARTRYGVQSPPGEANRLRYQGRGVAAVIAPWNFPLAIPTGMTCGALVAGNPVILKPAEQTPLVARQVVDALLAAGVPPGVVQFLPGMGEEVGTALVRHPAVAAIAFTGSKAVGLDINAQAARVEPGQSHVKRVVAEMGGNNALIVDSDADPDEAVPAVALSAFGFAGQKCSAAGRVIVLDAVYDRIVDRLVDYTSELVIGHPRDAEVQVGPVIDAEAHQRLRSLVDDAEQHGQVLLRRRDIPESGYFVGPTIVAADPSSLLARDEVFGPVLAVLRARDLDHAFALANDTAYALTAGVMTRSPGTISRATSELRGGNVYVNRAITGSVVGRQPFGGYGLSGVGAKAGGPEYLLQFMDPRVVTENTLRQGFAPDAA